MFVVSAALFVLIAVLGALQYRWLGQISQAERDRLRAGLNAAAAEFVADFDRELARAFLLFQHDASDLAATNEDVGERYAARFDRWQASAKFPRLVKEFYVVSQTGRDVLELRRFDPGSRHVVPAEWPAAMAAWRDRLASESLTDDGDGRRLFVRRMPAAIWEEVPAIVVPTPMIFLADPAPRIQVAPTLTYSILTIDLEYVKRELLPSLAARHFGPTGAAPPYQIAVVRRGEGGGVIFQSEPSFAPDADASADAAAELFQVRPQDFTTVASEVRRLAAATATKVSQDPHRMALPERPLSVLVQSGAAGSPRGTLADPGRAVGIKSTVTATARVTTSTSPAHWKLVVAHPAGSLEAAVGAQRRRNLAISSSILGLLGASMALLVVSTRRAQRLARQQMEFVATVSHELRTPLAVIRSAAENLADGVVHDEQKIRQYGQLMRSEGRRLTEMVEQVLEIAGMQSGQRGFALRPVAIGPMVREILSASAAMIEEAGLQVELDVADGLPPVLGDEPALRRVFQNLVDNAIKYGADGGWVRISARSAGGHVDIAVADRGLGIEPAEQERIFDPFYRAGAVVNAQIQGAGLGLSLVQRIVAAHGGRVTVKSAPGHGSEFIVQLPLAADAPPGRHLRETTGPDAAPQHS